MVLPPSTAVNRGGRQKVVDTSRPIEIVRTRGAFNAFVAAQRHEATPETLEDLDALVGTVIQNKSSVLNRTRPSLERVLNTIAVPQTCLQLDEKVKKWPYMIPRQYIRFMQHRSSTTGIRLCETVAVHYSLFSADFEFLELLNSRAAGSPLSLIDFTRLMDIFEKAAARCHRDQLFTSDLALLVARENGIRVAPYALREVHGHWVRRRREHGLPLLRHLWPSTDPADASPLAVFRPRAKDKMLLRRPKRGRTENIQRLYRIVTGFKRVLKLLSKIRLRDEKKLTLAQLEAILFDQTAKERVDPTYVCPLWRSILDAIRAHKLGRHKNLSHGKTLGFESLRGTGHLNLGASGECIPGTNLYKCTRASRRFGRGGRIWIDRRLLYEPKQPTEYPPSLSNGEQTHFAACYDYSRYSALDVYTPENSTPLPNNPGFACAYEATHLANTGGLYWYAMPEYLGRQLQTLALLECMSEGPHQSPSTV